MAARCWVSIERYRELHRQGAIVLPKANRNRLEIPATIIETEFNAAGDEGYRIHCAKIQAEHIIINMLGHK